MKGEGANMSVDGKHEGLLVWQEEPFNAEPPLDLLRENFVTPTELFFARNHAPFPAVDPSQYRLSIGGLVERALSLSLEEIREQFPRRTQLVTLQCAGNRRQELMEVAPIPGEVSWGLAAVSNAEWAGVALRDLLLAAGIAEEGRHVAFLGLDEVEKHGERFGFGGSIPLRKALEAEVLLAYEMNGAPLSPAHGYPLRAVVPGYIGARSVKWLSEITVQRKPSSNYYQAHAYKLFPPHVTQETVDWERGLMLGELPVNAVICHPREGEPVPAGPVRVQGYAITGGNRTVERVDLSLDGGETWQVAELAGDALPGAWRFWEATVMLPAGETQVLARAWDSSANTQPEQVAPLWNFKGYANNAWHRVMVTVSPT
jgi:sulfite oxidase